MSHTGTLVMVGEDADRKRSRTYRRGKPSSRDDQQRLPTRSKTHRSIGDSSGLENVVNDAV